MLPPKLRHRLQVMQQCRADDIEAVRNRYAALNIPAELLTYIEDMPDRLAEAHLVIARAGASTIAELTAAGRPAILVPLPIATDDHQTVNAREMAKAGGARMIPQDEFTPEAAERPDRGDRGGRAGAVQCGRARAVGRPAACDERPCRPGRADRGRRGAGDGRAGSRPRRPSMAMGAPA